MKNVHAARTSITVAAALALSACATPRYQVTKCLTDAQFNELKAQLPPKVADKLTGRADEDLRIVSGSAIRLRSYGEGLLDVLRGCVG